MGYRRMTKRDLWEIYRRWRAGQSVTRIARSQGRDRKTVREYIEGMRRHGVQAEDAELGQQEFYRIVEALLPQQTDRPMPAREDLERHWVEIHEMINRSEDPLKPKSAFIVIKRKYQIAASYETFKRFARERGLSRAERRRMIRIELPPGLETQLDYGRMGMLPDAVSGRNMVVWAFCGILSCSRYPFVQFVRTQDQISFVGSVVDMFEYYDGVTEAVSLDNLKSGVIKPDLWDPQLNRAFAEAADHYGVFVDPCRVARATDKGNAECMKM
jgi:transposase